MTIENKEFTIFFESRPKKIYEEAYFTNFEKETNWCSGEIGKYKFDAKLFDKGSSYGIEDGRVSKLAIYDEDIRQKEKSFEKSCIAHYDRGWDIEPKNEYESIYKSVMILLENAPKRFS